MSNFSNRSSGWSLLTLLAAVIVAEPVMAQQSTTGPVPPPGIDRGLRLFSLAQTVIPGVPAYVWRHGCGPTAVGMVVGYWDGNGFPNLVPGAATTQTAAVNAMIADDSGTPNCSTPDGDHYQDYSCPLDFSPTLLSDRSQTGGAHVSNCVGDFFRTSWSSRGNYYGWSWAIDAPGSFTNYVDLVAAQYNPSATNKTFSQFSWNEYKAEIDAGRPVMFLVDTDGDSATDHFVTGVGYDDASTQYGVYDTWDSSVHWFAWREMGAGRSWGIYGVTLFSLTLSPQVPSLGEPGFAVLLVLVLGLGMWMLENRRRRLNVGMP
jgi:hypothetical protein